VGYDSFGEVRLPNLVSCKFGLKFFLCDPNLICTKDINGDMVSLVASSVGSWFSFILLSNRISFLELDHACFDGLLCLVAKPFL
jgi:hypothetical protein